MGFEFLSRSEILAITHNLSVEKALVKLQASLATLVVLTLA